MAKIKMKNSATVADTFHHILTARNAWGLSKKAISTYGQHFSAIGKHLPTDTQIDKLKRADLETTISSMRDAGLAANSSKSNTRTLKSFFSRCNAEGVTRLNQPLYKAEETVKETYTEEELKALVCKPSTRK